MVSVLYFRTSVQGSSPGRGYCGMFLGETPYSHCAQVYKWVPVNLLLPGGVEILLVAYRESGKSSGLISHLACMQN